MTEFQQVLIETLDVFKDFCNEYKLSYYAGGGTAIGAVRHQGFIPWDDDIDVYMMRKDYDRMIEITRGLNATNSLYEVLHYSEPPYQYPFAKFSLTKHTVIESGEAQYVQGPWIDVFPLDEVYDDNRKARSLDWRYNYSIGGYEKCLSKHRWNEIVENVRAGEYYTAICIVRRMLLFPFWLRGFYLKWFERCENEARNVRGRRLLSYYHRYSLEKETQEKAWYSNYEEVPFENSSIRLMAGTHEYLTRMFGDYMVVPPPHKRVKHYLYFVNLGQRLSYKEACEIRSKRAR